MNVIVSNKKSSELTLLDIDVIKSITGEYSVDELISMFKTFFYEKMIIDVTAIKNYNDINTVERLAMGLGADKIILVLTDELCSGSYLSGIIDVGIYNFTNNIKAIKRLIARPNSYDDVKKLREVGNESNTEAISTTDDDKSSSNNKFSRKIIGFKNITENAGATSLIYMLMKEAKRNFLHGVYALELDRRDFSYFGNKNMISIDSNDLDDKINSLSDVKVVFVDLNDCDKISSCNEVIYLLEPSTIKLNKLIKTNSSIFSKLSGKKIVLNKSMLSNKDVTEFEYEANIKTFYNIPCLDDRADNNNLNDFLFRLGIGDSTGAKQTDGSKIFGIFKH